MSQTDSKPVSQTQTTPSQDFAAFCEAEFERRRNSGADFDEQRYRSALALVMDKLERIESEGRS